ncbi:MAG: TlpA family protein disulfide reductase, partial [Odoribacter sp.]|nr:TlpA family protein disulfide reductase [Odoribacter sp.]
IMNFIRNNPKSFVSAMNLLEHYAWFDENEIEQIYEQFPASLKMTQYGRVLKRKLDAGRPFRTGTSIQHFTKKDMNGKSVSSARWKGKYVLLDFWGSWCGPCRASHPHLKELYKKYGAKMVFVNVAQENAKDLAKARSLWKQAVAEDGLTWTQVLNNEGFEACNLLELFHISSFPTKILIDPEGRIAGRYVGATTDIDQKLTEVMGY